MSLKGGYKYCKAGSIAREDTILPVLVAQKNSYLLLQLKSKDVEGLVHDLHLLDVVDGVHGDLAQAGRRVVVNVV